MCQERESIEDIVWANQEGTDQPDSNCYQPGHCSPAFPPNERRADRKKEVTRDNVPLTGKPPPGGDVHQLVQGSDPIALSPSTCEPTQSEQRAATYEHHQRIIEHAVGPD